MRKHKQRGTPYKPSWSERVATFSIHGAQASERDVEHLASDYMELLLALRNIAEFGCSCDVPELPEDQVIECQACIAKNALEDCKHA